MTEPATPHALDLETLSEAMAQHGAMRYAAPVDVRRWEAPGDVSPGSDADGVGEDDPLRELREGDGSEQS